MCIIIADFSSNDLELRIFSEQDRSDEDMVVAFVELYVSFY